MKTMTLTTDQLQDLREEFIEFEINEMSTLFECCRWCCSSIEMGNADGQSRHA